MLDPITLQRNLRRTKLISAEEVKDPLSYVLDYQVDSSRGFRRNLVRCAVNNKKLYTFTVQFDQNLSDIDSSIEDTAKDIIDSFKLENTR